MNSSQLELEDRRIRLAAQLLAIDEVALLETFEKLIATMADRDTRSQLSKQELQIRLDQALQDSKGGKTIEPDDLIAEIDAWGSLS